MHDIEKKTKKLASIYCQFQEKPYICIAFEKQRNALKATIQ